MGSLSPESLRVTAWKWDPIVAGSWPRERSDGTRKHLQAHRFRALSLPDSQVNADVERDRRR